MKQWFVFLLLSLFPFLRKKTEVEADSTPTAMPLRFVMERWPTRFSKKTGRVKRSAVKQTIYLGRRWRAHYRAIREFRLDPTSSEPAPAP